MAICPTGTVVIKDMTNELLQTLTVCFIFFFPRSSRKHGIRGFWAFVVHVLLRGIDFSPPGAGQIHFYIK